VSPRRPPNNVAPVLNGPRKRLPPLVGGAALALLLSSCATQEQTGVLQTAYGDCVMAAVIRVDDGKTDPVSMAYGIAPQCGVLYQQLTEAEVSQFITDVGQANMRRVMRDKEVQVVTSAILIHRSKQRPAKP
jgi:hypothetical protein